MEEEKVAQEAELADRIVRGTHGLLALKTCNTDADVRSCNHVDIVCSIADSQSGLVWVSFAYHMDDFSFLLGTDTASQDDISTLAQVNKFFLDYLVRLDSRQGITCNDHGVISCLLGQVLVTFGLRDLNAYLLRIGLLQNEHVHLHVEQFARVSDIDGRLNLVTS